MYGGRVSDSFDRRILTTYLEEYLGDFLFDAFQPFHFFKNENVEYNVPIEGHRSTYVETIEALPLVQTPEVFGLHPNADISYYTNATKQIWRDLVDLQPRTSTAGGGVTREEFIAGVAKDIQSRLPEPFDLPMLKKEMPVPTPTQVVLLQEIARWNILVVKMRISLRDLQVAPALHGVCAFESVRVAACSVLASIPVDAESPCWRDWLLGAARGHCKRSVQRATAVDVGEA